MAGRSAGTSARLATAGELAGSELVMAFSITRTMRVSPQLAAGGIGEDFGEAASGGGGTIGARGQGRKKIMGRKKILGFNFVVGRGDVGPVPMAHDEQHDVVAGEMALVGIDAKQFGRRIDHDAAFLVEFTRQGGVDSLALFDASPWKAPAGLIGVANQENVPCAIDDDALRAKCQRPLQAPKRLQQSPVDKFLRRTALAHRAAFGSINVTPFERFVPRWQGWARNGRAERAAGTGGRGSTGQNVDANGQNRLRSRQNNDMNIGGTSANDAMICQN